MIDWKRKAGLFSPFLFWPSVCSFKLMRLKSLTILLLVITFQAVVAQKAEVISKVAFTSATRGYQKQVFITKDSVKIILDGRAGNGITSRKLSGGEWNDLLKSLDDMKLARITELESPTSRRAFDGARQSTITIFSENKSFSHSFDDENPHPELQPLMTCITKIIGSENER
jgi:hypothetical protein